jgi:hypothetical protein
MPAAVHVATCPNPPRPRAVLPGPPDS